MLTVKTIKTLSRSLLLASSALAVPGMAFAGHSFTNDNPGDPNFNQLLGINDNQIIAGYFGDGATILNHGFVEVPFTHYSDENFAGKPPKGHTVTQTQAIGINNAEVPTIVGFWADQNGVQYGFEDVKGVFTTILDPNGVSGQNQNLLSVNSAGRAAGFWSDGTNEHGFIVDLGDTPPKFTEIPPKLFNGGVATQASGINDNGQVCGFWNDGAGNSHGFIGPKGGPYKTFNVTINGKMATSTQAFGCSNNFIVGGFLEGGKQHGFKYDGTTFTQIDAPGSKQTAAFGVSGTFINGVNDKGDVVGFFSDGSKVHGYVNFVVSTP